MIKHQKRNKIQVRATIEEESDDEISNLEAALHDMSDEEMKEITAIQKQKKAIKPAKGGSDLHTKDL